MKKPDKHTSDDELYQLLCCNETKEAAFRVFYERYKSRVYGYCRKVVGDPSAADILQESFVRFYTSAHSDREMKNIIGYLMTIARNLCLNHKERVERAIVEFKDVEELQLPDIPEEMRDEEEMKKAIHSAMDLLGDEYREAVYLQVYSGLSYQEIAEVIDKPITTVRNRVVRAKTKLRQLLAPYFKEINE